MLEAYRRAAQTLSSTRPGCRIPWTLLAGVGRVESAHASQGWARAAGNTRGNILGIALDGSRTAAIRDTDRGRLDNDPVWGRAVGPMLCDGELRQAPMQPGPGWPHRTSATPRSFSGGSTTVVSR